MTKDEAFRYGRLIETLSKYGLDHYNVNALLKIERTLSRWACLECGDSNDYASWAIERDEVTDLPYLVRHPHDSNNVRRTRIPDREKGALKRASAILANTGLSFYHQTDPRGCSLYVLRHGDVKEGEDVSSIYNRGIAVCV